MKLLATLLVIAGCLEANPVTGCDADPANLVQNCGFETGDFTSWTAGGDTSSLFVGDFNSHSGTYAAIFSFLFNGSEDFSTGPSLSQSFATSAGDSYVLSYELSDLSSDPNGFQALWNGSAIPGSPVTNVTDFDYTLYQFTVVGTGSDTLQFQSYQDDLSDWFLDDVTLDNTGVPEPSSLLLIAGGLAAFGALRRSSCIR
jgi:PEP-CTERM motif-containing protein